MLTIPVFQTYNYYEHYTDTSDEFTNFNVTIFITFHEYIISRKDCSATVTINTAILTTLRKEFKSIVK